MTEAVKVTSIEQFIELDQKGASFTLFEQGDEEHVDAAIDTIRYSTLRCYINQGIVYYTL